MKKLKVILIGAGGRGTGYTNIMAEQPDKFQVVAVAEPIEERREYIRRKHNVPEDMCFTTWEPLLEMDKFADAAVICTMDRMHHGPAMAAIDKGYDLLLEKPAAPTPEECWDIANAAKKKGVKILVCHVLRYTLFYRKLKELIDNGTIGKVISIHADECVGNTHQSHSFVRGNWGNSEKSSFMLLQKCCHDMDILQWLIGKKCKKVQSFGSLTYFTEENAPEGATAHCMDGCPHMEDCYYSTQNVYFRYDGWFRRRVTDSLYRTTDEELTEALRAGDFGRCVFKCDNDVVDHQVVNLEFEDGATVSFNMCAFNKGGRNIRIMGTKGELVGDMEETTIKLFSFADRTTTDINPSDTALGSGIDSGHGGGDSGIINVFYDYLTVGYEGDLLSEIGVSAENHMIAFAAEHSRLTGTVVDVDEYTGQFKEEE
ncbi:MAG: Gfo/Idh/MocA family oxidoreductase [Clostridia bacterium]|nr:Gfo/Idh/MocA family oxidoreductase [Clostridia bacterium]